MYSDCCPGNFSSCSLGSPLRYLGISRISSCPNNLVYSTDICSPRTCPLGSSLYRSCQETCYKPSSCQTSCVVSKPCKKTYTGSLCFGSRSSCSLGYGTRSSYPLGCGSSGLRTLDYGVRGFSSLGYRSGFCCPTYFPSRSCQSFCYRPTCVSSFC
ncbi:keratin-associated protein 13-2-like [Choloepus didactylus]|uniref:keratin-associated protein 13-2-like n=1 Tax=Choloepus didactylus TaxID=27675 RepID=UPI00189FC883|nr:keratin-associated protein 13-2-like [Choloepus didactylus]